MANCEICGISKDSKKFLKFHDEKFNLHIQCCNCFVNVLKKNRDIHELVKLDKIEVKEYFEIIEQIKIF